MPEKVYYAPVETTWGTFMIASTEKGICQVHFLRNDAESFFAWLKKNLGSRGILNLRVLRDAAGELTEYLLGHRKQFDLPLDLRGTPFQLRVWDQLRTIPYGETASYGEIARAAGTPKGARAVGMANHANPVLLLVPCHRVIGSNGALVGFGCGLDLKQKLLNLERNYK
ncbi:MAG: methylated-DNA--[protein]-cysteine S-methyltransferase [Bacillota bacterium]